MFMLSDLRHLAIASLILSLSAGLGSCVQTSHSISTTSTAAIASSTEATTPAKSLGETLSESPAVHQDYVAIDLNTLPPGKPFIGHDPKTVAVEVFGPTEPVEGFFEQTVEAQQVNDQVIVILTQTGLPDDSIQGMRYRLEFVPTAGDQWRLVWAGKQYTCQPGRGNQEWSAEWCN